MPTEGGQGRHERYPVCHCARLPRTSRPSRHGLNAGPSQALWVGLSQIEPGGSIERGASPLEKHYVVLAGEVTVLTDDGEAVLGMWDSVCLAPGEARALQNRSGAPASVLLAMPLPP